MNNVAHGGVALRKESVDRNNVPFRPASHLSVALRKESVDRNIASRQLPTPEPPSLSARRAWIEIIDYIVDYATDAVALRKESVDRNREIGGDIAGWVESLSARRAWIEMNIVSSTPLASSSRSPQGERG